MLRVGNHVTGQAARSAAFLSLLLSSLLGALAAATPAAAPTAEPISATRSTVPAAAHSALIPEIGDYAAIDGDDGNAPGGDPPFVAAGPSPVTAPITGRAGFDAATDPPLRPLSCGLGFDARAPPAA